MDAVHLIKATRHALAECRFHEEVVAEAWQAQALAVAVGGHLAHNGPQLVRAEALMLSETGNRPRVGDVHAPEPHIRRARAARLSEIQDPRVTLLDLCGLLAETAEALVGVAVSAEEDGLYWQCIEAIDAADESGDRASGILRRLELQEHGGAA